MKPKIKERSSSFYGIILLFFFLFALRAIYITADPPVNLDWSGGIFFDEGMLVHGARNKILFGEWNLDGWNDFYISPILAYLKWLVFYLVGVGMAQERLIPLFFSYLTLIFFYLTFKQSFNRKTATLALFLLGFNYIFVMFNRLGLTETSVVFFMVLTGYFWQKGFSRLHNLSGYRSEVTLSLQETETHHSCHEERQTVDNGRRRINNGPWYFFLSGVSCFVAYIFKNFPYFLPVPIVAMLLSFYILPKSRAQSVDKEAWGSRHWLQPIGYCLAGMLLSFLIWYVFFYLPHFPSINQAMNYFKCQSLPQSLNQVLFNISHFPFFSYFMKTPVELFFSFLAIGYFIYLFSHHQENGQQTTDPVKLYPLDLFMLCWYLAHFLFYAGLNYRPLRYYVPIIPPMCALAARIMVSWSSLQIIKIPKRLSILLIPFWVFWLTIFLAYGVLLLLSRLSRFFPIRIPDLTWERGVLSSLSISLIAILLAVLICKKWQGQSWSLPRRWSLAGFFVLPFLAIVLTNGYQYYQWAAYPRYVIRDISRELGSTLQNAFIAGLGAPMICLENTHRALHVFDNFFNYRTIFTRYRVTHLFMGAYNDEVEFYYRKFAYPMRRATLMKVYPIKESHFYLYSMVEPAIEKIQVSVDQSLDSRSPVLSQIDFSSQTSGSDHRIPLKVLLSVKNNDSNNLKEVKTGWRLYPVNSAPGGITVITPSSISLKPGEIAEVSLSGEAAPGTYYLMAFTLPSYQNIFEAEFLHHLIGEKQKDPEASNDEAWKVRGAVQNPGYAVYGPYLRYPAGHLKVFFRLKTSDNTTKLPVAQIDVVTDMSEKTLVTRDLRGVDFKTPGTYEEFELFFFLENPQKLEFRVFSYGHTDLWIDRVRVELTRGWWYEEPVMIGEPPMDL